MALKNDSKFHISRQQRQLLARSDHAEIRTCYRASIAIKNTVAAEYVHDALLQIVQRHEIFHTRFVLVDGMSEPVQHLTPERPCFKWSVVKKEQSILSDSEDPKNDTLFKAVFDVSREQISMLFLTISALIGDSRTLANIASELSEILGGYKTSDDHVQYVDFAQWQDDVVSEDKPSESYWAKNKIADNQFTCISGKEREQQTFGLSDVFELEIPPEATDDRAQLMSLWMTLVYRVWGKSEIVILVNFDGRISTEFSRAMGPYSRMIPVLLNVKAENTAEKIRTDIERKLELIESHQMSYPPMYAQWPAGTMACSFRSSQAAEATVSVHAELTDVVFLHDDCSLSVDFFKHEDRWRARFIFDSGLLDVSFVEQLKKSLQALAINWRPNLSADHQKMVSECGPSAVLTGPPSAHSTTRVSHAIERSAMLVPEAVAIEAGSATLTYEKLNTLANKLAHAIIEKQLSKGSVVSLCFNRGIEISIAILAALKAGIAFTLIDPALPLFRKQLLISKSALVITDAPLIDDDLLGVEDVQAMLIDSRLSGFSKYPESNPRVESLPEDTAYVLYTSGSTGEPKGVCVRHAGLESYLDHAAKTYFERAEASIVHTSIGFDLTITSLLTPLVLGKVVIMVADEPGIESLKNTLLKKNHLMMLKLTPSHLKAMNPWLAGLKGSELTVETLVVGGEALHKIDLEILRKKFPAIRIFNEYGPTEATVGCCVFEYTSSSIVLDNVPIGHPIAGTSIYLLDQNGISLPPLCIGELYVGGVGLASGYLNSPGDTAKKFVPMTLSDGKKTILYKTGDLVKFDLKEGNGLVYVGRYDRQLKIRGHRVEPGEVEAVLKEKLRVSDLVVKGIPNQFGDDELVAYIQADTPQPLNIFLETGREVLPDYMLPSRLVTLAKFPLNRNGKVDFDALPKRGLEANAEEPAYVAPRDKREKLLVDAYKKVLKLESVGVKDNFFTRGGDSIRAVHFVSVLKESGLQIKIEDLFENRTVERLAKVIEEREKEHIRTESQLKKSLLDELEKLTDEEVDERLSALKGEA